MTGDFTSEVCVPGSRPLSGEVSLARSVHQRLNGAAGADDEVGLLIAVKVGDDRVARRNPDWEFGRRSESSVTLAGAHFGVCETAAARVREIHEAVTIEVGNLQTVSILVERSRNRSAEVAFAVSRKHRRTQCSRRMEGSVAVAELYLH